MCETDRPKLLIIVPTLDSLELLPRLVSSLQQQTWPYWRLIFIDGPSSPQHRAWLQQCCSAEHRCSWVAQDPHRSGIFGAMNQGFSQAAPEDWLLFWGSDDWAASPSVIASAISEIQAADQSLDLLVCRARYASAVTQHLARTACFHSSGLLGNFAYRRALWFGATPPHQATFFGPGARAKLGHYDPSFNLSADLNYFLQISRHPSLLVLCRDLEIVHISDGGVSGKQVRNRLAEVRRAYRSVYGLYWLFPYLARYVRRLISLMLSYA